MSITMLMMGGIPAFSIEKDGRKAEMKKLIPLEVEGYKADGKDELCDRQTTFRYMDGAAELYRSYAFKLLMVRRYLKPDHPPIIVELFDMGTSEDAFGIFSYETGEEEVEIGQGSDYGGGLLRFWKEKYFTNVFAEKETSYTRKDVLQIGHAIAENIKQEGQKPKMINYLPGEEREERNIRYFRLHQILNHHYFISHQNLFNLDQQTNAILASYASKATKGKTYFLIIQYPSKKLAEVAFRNFFKVYMPEASSSRVVQTENNKWTMAKVHQKYVMVVFDALSKGKAEELIGATEKRLEGK